MNQRGASVSVRILEKVAAATGSDPLDLPPLSNTVDPDALDTTVFTMETGEICFEYAGHTVTVESTGFVRLDDHLTDTSIRDTTTQTDHEKHGAGG